MSIQLYEHNQTAYDAAIAMLRETGRAAVVHPTGTGKSFIGFKLCEDFPKQTICWLSPSEYIFKTQTENLKQTSGGYWPANACFYTYAKLMLMDEQEMREIKPDCIILDEFHRCGASMWGQGVKRLLCQYPHVPVLGLSATSIRYLDNRRDMSDELFGGCVASEMTLGEAIVRGILSPPRYVTAVYSYQKDLERYERRVQKLRGKARRENAQRHLEALRRKLEKADGLSTVFEKNITDRTGKYIVFCANKEHMDTMMDKAPEWFAKIDSDPHVYSVYSEDPFATQSFMDFKADNDERHLRLLFCIDALNEGIHVEDISGVILLRPTISPTVYKQQIGRALCAGSRKTPVIFDIVNNVAGLYSIASIEEEMEEAVQYYQFQGKSSYIVNGRFQIDEEIQDVRRLFDALEDALSVSWDFMYGEAKKYYLENGSLLLPHSYVTENGCRLGRWLAAQRVNYRNKNGISQEKIQKLEEIGMSWQTQHERQWEEGYALAKAYYAKYGGLNVPRGESPRLSGWLVRQRQKYREGTLGEEQYLLLTALDMVWEFDDAWNEKFTAAKKYYQTHGNLDIPAFYVTENGLTLGTWYRGVRSQYRAGKLSDERIQMLEAIGIKWQSVNDRSWMRHFEAARRYYEEHGDLNVNTEYETPEGLKLGVWISSQRYNRKRQKLTDGQMRMLDGIGMSWQRFACKWDSAYEYCKTYFQENGSVNAAAKYVTEDGFALGKWVASQRRKYHAGKLTEDQAQRLQKLGMIWSPTDNTWYTGYEHARRFAQQYGHLNAPGGCVTDDGYKLGVWLSNQRTRRKDGRMTQEQCSLLENIGMQWEIQSSRWQTGYCHAQEYSRQYGNLDVPQKYICGDGYTLGEWIASQRRSYKDGKLPEEKKLRLEELGLVWNIYADRWNRGYNYARSYRKGGGTIPIPKTFVTGDGYPLGEWMRTQERCYRRGSLEEEKIRRLAEIGVLL